MVESSEAQEQDDQINDPTVFAKDSEVSMNDFEFEFWVRNPQDNGGTITYETRGKDRQGIWECKRRYNEFFLLNETLQKRFPGIPIPIVPPKKAIGNKDMTFIQDRTFYLQRFLRKCARFDFIIESPEFQIFCRPQGGVAVDKGLERLFPMSTAQLYDRIKAVTDTDIDSVDLIEKEKSISRITSFLMFVKNVEPVLTKIKADLSKYLMSKQRSMQAYGEMSKFTQRYEELNMTHYSDLQSNLLIFQNPANQELRDAMATTAAGLRNPYIDLYHWVKGEIYDIEAMRNAIKKRAEVAEALRNLEAKKASTQKDLESVSTGKTTVTTMFKSSSDATSMANKIETTEREITSHQQLLDLLSIYIGGKLMQSVKKEKLALYHRILKQFTVIEIQNAHISAGFWSKVLTNDKVKA